MSQEDCFAGRWKCLVFAFVGLEEQKKHGIPVIQDIKP
jgi:hypothetical protein